MFCRTLDLRSKSKNICLVEECSRSVDPDPSVSELLVSLVPLQLIYRCKIDQFIGHVDSSMLVSLADELHIERRDYQDGNAI